MNGPKVEAILRDFDRMGYYDPGVRLNKAEASIIGDVLRDWLAEPPKAELDYIDRILQVRERLSQGFGAVTIEQAMELEAIIRKMPA